MNYIDVQWLHASAEDPTRLVSEIGPDRFETRKIEFWADGRIGYASKDHASPDTALGDLPVPTIEEINSQSEFSAKELDAISFERLWAHYGGRGLRLVECAVTFLTPAEGGPTAAFPPAALSDDRYRPHLVVGARDQRQADVDDRGWSAEEYIGVAFHEGPPVPQAGTTMRVVLLLMYFPHQMYDRLQPGVTFTVREGPQVVAHGEVCRWLE